MKLSITRAVLRIRIPCTARRSVSHQILCQFRLLVNCMITAEKKCHQTFQAYTTAIAGLSGLVVTRLPAAREDPGSRRAAGKSLCFHENHCDTQLWARAAH